MGSCVYGIWHSRLSPESLTRNEVLRHTPEPLWLLRGSPRSSNASSLVTRRMTAGVKACTSLLEFYWFVTPTQPDA